MTLSDVGLLNTITTVSGDLPLVLARYNPNSALSQPPGPSSLQQTSAQIERLRRMGICADNISRGTETHLSPVVAQAFATSLNQIETFKILDATAYATSRRGVSVPFKNARGDVIFHPVMIHERQVSLVNRRNQPEFYSDSSKPLGLRYNTSFYTNHQDIKTVKNKKGHYEPFGILEIGGYIPEWAVTETKWVAHNEAVDAMKTKSAYIDNTNVMFLSFKGIYRSIMVNILSSPLVARARELDWEPVLLVKNLCLMETNDFGIHGWTFTTMNKSPKSFVSLLGFSHVQDPDNVVPTVKIISLTNCQNQLLAIK